MDNFDRALAEQLGVAEEYEKYLSAEGAEEQEAAAPAAGTDEEGVEEQEAAAPADVDTDDEDAEEDDSEAADSDGDDGGETTPGGQSPEDDARFAAARRRAEQERDEAIARAREESRAELYRELDDAFATSGLLNPYTREPIRSRAEFESYRTRHAEEQRRLVMGRTGMDDAQYTAFVESLPEVRQARLAQQEAAKQQAQMDLHSELDKIRAIDPAITDAIALGKSERFAEVRDLTHRGYALSDAYKLVHYERLTAAKAQQQATNAARAQRQAEMSAASKQHLHRSPGRGADGLAEVPGDVMKAYRAAMPDLTDAEIIAHYTKYIKDKE